LKSVCKLALRPQGHAANWWSFKSPTAYTEFDWQFTFDSWHCHSSSKWRQ